MTISVYTLGTTEADRWHEILQWCDAYDVYHLPQYHKLVEKQDNSRAVFFVCQSGAMIVAMPMLLREIGEIPGLERSRYRDVTSVYGYAGPVFTSDLSDELVRSFGRSLQDYLKSQNVVTAFSRLHPFYDQAVCLEYLDGEIQSVGPTVALDLTLPAQAQYQQYRGNLRRDIQKAKKQGVVCIHDTGWQYLDRFVDIYYQTMRRNCASDLYYFDREYFSELHALLGDYLHLFVAVYEGTVLSGALFTVCNSIIQYHLAGTDIQHRDLASSKLILDTVRIWGKEIGASVFHLGGGVGSQRDSLFQFKAGFSKLTCQFRIWKMITDQAAYLELVERKEAWNQAHDLQAISADFFPAYRCPTRPASQDTDERHSGQA